MTFSNSGWNGAPCFDLGAAGTTGASTASVSLGAFSVFGVIQGNAGSEVPITHNTGGAVNGFFVYGLNGPASNVSRSSVRSARNVASNWLADATKHSFAVTYNGTHATHLVYKDGIDTAATTFSGLGSDPGVTPLAGPIYLGYTNASNTGVRGLAAFWVLFNRAITPAEVAELQRYAHGRGLL